MATTIDGMVGSPKVATPTLNRDQILNILENHHRMLRGKQRLGDQTRLDDPTYRYSNVNIQIAVESMAVIGDRLIAECCFELERELANIPGTRHTIF